MPEISNYAQSFEEYAMPLFDSLYNFAMWLARNREEAEDLVQEAYARALKGFSSFQPGTNFRAWMFQILKNAFLTSRSKSVVQVSIEEDDDRFSHERTPESAMVGASMRQQIQNALERLPLQYREV